MAQVDASGNLLAARADVWALLAEPGRMPDWWPGYRAVRPDTTGLAEGARWTIVRSLEPSLLRRPEAEGTVVVRRVEPGRALSWHDAEEQFDALIELTDDGDFTSARFEVTA